MYVYIGILLVKAFGIPMYLVTYGRLASSRVQNRFHTTSLRISERDTYQQKRQQYTVFESAHSIYNNPKTKYKTTRETTQCNFTSPPTGNTPQIVKYDAKVQLFFHLRTISEAHFLAQVHLQTQGKTQENARGGVKY